MPITRVFAISASILRFSRPGQYRKPLQVTRRYLDELDAVSVPRDRRVLAAMGPKMLELARDGAGGAHPFVMTPEHTKVAREGLATYLPLANYQDSWRRLGFGEDDFADGGSDRLIDHVVVWGDEATIATRVQAHFGAGADHVCVQALTGTERTDFPRAEWRALASALVGLTRR
jgi:hypothetical protein